MPTRSFDVMILGGGNAGMRVNRGDPRGKAHHIHVGKPHLRGEGGLGEGGDRQETRTASSVSTSSDTLARS